MIIRGSAIALLLFSLFLITQAKKYIDPEKNDQEWQEFQQFQEWKKFKSSREKELISSEEKENREENANLERIYEKTRKEEFKKGKEKENKSVQKNDERQRWKDKKRAYQKSNDFDKMKNYERIQDEQNRNDPPPINQPALMARYIVNQANWTSVATISSRKDIRSFPSANVISFSDGLLGNGSGIPYMYLTPLDFTAQDIFKDSRASLMMTLAQGRYCSNKNYDPMDPRCARVILTGKIKSVKNDSAEIEIAKNAVFGRHPWLQNMPADHHFFFAKLKIISIAMLDTFGGPKFVTVKDYLHPPTPNATTEFSHFKLEGTTTDFELQESASDLVHPDVRLV